MEFGRLDNLPESLRLHILSFLDIKHAVQTSVLSTSWRSLWMLMPVLHLDDGVDIREQGKFDKLVNMIMSSRDQSLNLNKLTLWYDGECTNTLNKVIDYAFSQGVKQLEVHTWPIDENGTWPIGSSDSLTSLKLISLAYIIYPCLLSGSFKNLTVLHLRGAIIQTPDPFLRFPMLEKLTLHRCCVRTNGQRYSVYDLKHISDPCELIIPNLRFFDYQGSEFPLFRSHDDGFPVLDTVLIDSYAFCLHSQDKDRMFDGLISLFRDFHNAKSLTLSSTIVYGLSLFQDKLMNLKSPFCNLKCLKVDLRCTCNLMNLFEVPSNVKAYLLHNSPEAKFTIIHD